MKNKLASYYRYCICCGKWMNSEIVGSYGDKYKEYRCLKCGIIITRTMDLGISCSSYFDVEIEYSFKFEPNSTFDITKRRRNKVYYISNSFNNEWLYNTKDFKSAYLIVKKLIKNKDLF